MRRHLRAGARRVHRGGVALDQKVVERVLDVGRRVLRSEQPCVVGLVLGEQQRRVGIDVQVVVVQRLLEQRIGVVGMHHGQPRTIELLQHRLRAARPLRPGVAEPQRRQQVQRRRVGTAVGHGDAHQQVLGRGLGVFDEDVEVAPVVEHAGVQQFVLGLVPAAAAIGLHQVVVGVGRLRVLVQVLHVRVRGRAVEVEVVLLDVFAVVALAVGQAEGTLLQDRVAAVPQRQREAQHLVVVADAGQAVLAPAVGARARLVVAEIVPRVAVVAVVLAHRAPLALAQIRAPLLPVRTPLACGVEPGLLCICVHLRCFLVSTR